MICIGALRETEYSSKAEAIINKYIENSCYKISFTVNSDIKKVIPIKADSYSFVFSIFPDSVSGKCETGTENNSIFEQDKSIAVLFLSRLFTELISRNYKCELFISDEKAASESIPMVSIMSYELAEHLSDDNQDIKCCHFVFKDDWRLNDQMDYLDGEKLERDTFRATKTNDHDHCCFCWKTFSECPEDTHIGYCTDDRYCWICDECYNDYKFIFRWNESDNA